MPLFNIIIKDFGDRAANHIQQQLHFLNLNLIKMSLQYDDLKAVADRISASQARVRADIGDLASKINPDGMTAAEAQALKAQMLTIADEEDAQDALTPDAPIEPPTEPTV